MEKNELAAIHKADQESSQNDLRKLTSNNSEMPNKTFIRAKSGKTTHEIQTKQFKEDNCLESFYKDECFNFELSQKTQKQDKKSTQKKVKKFERDGYHRFGSEDEEFKTKLKAKKMRYDSELKLVKPDDKATGKMKITKCFEERDITLKQLMETRYSGLRGVRQITNMNRSVQIHSFLDDGDLLETIPVEKNNNSNKYQTSFPKLTTKQFQAPKAITPKVVEIYSDSDRTRSKSFDGFREVDKRIHEVAKKFEEHKIYDLKNEDDEFLLQQQDLSPISPNESTIGLRGTKTHERKTEKASSDREDKSFDDHQSEKSSLSNTNSRGSSLRQSQLLSDETDHDTHNEFLTSQTEENGNSYSETNAFHMAKPPHDQSQYAKFRKLRNRICMSPRRLKRFIYEKEWTPFEVHKYISTVLFYFSLLIFVLYKCYWRDLVKQVQQVSEANALDYDITQETFSLYAVLWWYRYLQRSLENKTFVLQTDIDGSKVFIFLNTVFMNNFSISQKLSTYDAYISKKNPEKFKFQFWEIFARKPLKKIKKNVWSKFVRLLIAKIVMKACLIDSDDIIFVMILFFHQFCFLYYIQMNCENNYLKNISDIPYLNHAQLLLKKYSKASSLLVKVNKNYIKKSYQWSMTIVLFVFRLNLSQCLKTLIIQFFSKKGLPSQQKLWELFLSQFHRVSLPTFVLYLTIIMFHQNMCYSGSLMLYGYCTYYIYGIEKMYVCCFVYTDYRHKIKKWGDKKKQKVEKLKEKSQYLNMENDYTEGSANELFTRAKNKRDPNDDLSSENEEHSRQNTSIQKNKINPAHLVRGHTPRRKIGLHSKKNLYLQIKKLREQSDKAKPANHQKKVTKQFLQPNLVPIEEEDEYQKEPDAEYNDGGTKTTTIYENENEQSASDAAPVGKDIISSIKQIDDQLECTRVESQKFNSDLDIQNEKIIHVDQKQSSN